jgi:hypothetical protein
VLCAHVSEYCSCLVYIVVLIVNIIIKVAFNYYIRISKAIISLYNLYIERLYLPSKDIKEYYVKLLFLDIYCKGFVGRSQKDEYTK